MGFELMIANFLPSELKALHSPAVGSGMLVSCCQQQAVFSTKMETVSNALISVSLPSFTVLCMVNFNDSLNKLSTYEKYHEGDFQVDFQKLCVSVNINQDHG